MALKQRGARCTADQMEIIINYILENRVILTGKTEPNNTNEIDKQWQKLVEMLNSARGARKSVEEWRRFFTEWKNKTRAKTSESKINTTATGGRAYKDRKLSELEGRLMTTIGWVSVSGATDLPPEIEPGEYESVPLIENKNVIIENLLDGEYDKQTLTPTLGPPQSIVTCGKKKPKPSRKMPTINPTSALEKSAERYEKSNIRLTTAIEAITESINKLATAIEKFAVAMEIFSSNK